MATTSNLSEQKGTTNHQSIFKMTEHTDYLEAGRHCDTQGTSKNRACECLLSDPETGVVPGLTRDRNMRSRYRCSMCPAIHTNSRSWLRSSSTCEPSDPPLRVYFVSYPKRVLISKAFKACLYVTVVQCFQKEIVIRAVLE